MKRTYGVPTMRELSPARQTLVRLCQKLNFGRIERLHVRYGEPCFNPSPTLIREHLFGGDNAPRAEHRSSDFALKDEHIELFALLDRYRDGVLERLEIKSGLPFRAHVQEPIS